MRAHKSALSLNILQTDSEQHHKVPMSHPTESFLKSGADLDTEPRLSEGRKDTTKQEKRQFRKGRAGGSEKILNVTHA